MGQTVRFKETLRMLMIAPVAGLSRVVAAPNAAAARSGMTPRPRWKNQTITDAFADRMDLPVVIAHREL